MRPSLFVGFSLTVLTASSANVQEIHFAPEERLDAIDADPPRTRSTWRLTHRLTRRPRWPSSCPGGT